MLQHGFGWWENGIYGKCGHSGLTAGKVFLGSGISVIADVVGLMRQCLTARTVEGRGRRGEFCWW